MRGVMIAVLFVVVPSFVVFYGWQRRTGRGGMPEGVAATIKFGMRDKVEVGKADVAVARQYLIGRLQAYSQLSGQPIDQKVIEEVATPKAVVREAINLKFLEHFARQNGIVVTESDVIEDLKRQIPPEQRDFFIQMIERRTGMTFDDYVLRMRYSLLLQRIREVLAAQTRVSVYDAWLEYKKRNEKLVVDFVRLAVSDYFDKVKVDEATLKRYYEEHRQDFEVPDQVVYAYLLVRKSDLKTSVTVTDDDITSYYAAHEEDFRLPPKVKVREIFLARPRLTPDKPLSREELTSRTEEVRRRAQDLYQQIVKGEDFAALADRYSEATEFPPREKDEQTTSSDEQTTAGGNLGFISRTTAKTFYGDVWTSTVFNLAVGALHPPIETARGFHIVKVEARKEGTLQPLEKVRDLVRERVLEEKVQPLFEQMGEELRKNSQKFTSLEKLAEVTSQTVRVTDRVNKGTLFIQGIGFLGDFQEAIMDLQKGGRSDVLSDANRHLVIELRQEFPAHIPEFDAIRDRVEKAYRDAQARELALADAQKIRDRAVNLEGLRTAAKDFGLTVTRSAPFKRSEVATFVGDIPNFEEVSLKLKTGQTELSPLGNEQRPVGYIVWHLTERTPPSQEEFRNELPKITAELLDRRVEVLISEYLRDQWQKLGSAIKIDPAFQ